MLPTTCRKMLARMFGLRGTRKGYRLCDVLLLLTRVIAAAQTRIRENQPQLLADR